MSFYVIAGQLLTSPVQWKARELRQNRFADEPRLANVLLWREEPQRQLYRIVATTTYKSYPKLYTELQKFAAKTGGEMALNSYSSIDLAVDFLAGRVQTYEPEWKLGAPLAIPRPSPDVTVLKSSS